MNNPHFIHKCSSLDHSPVVTIREGRRIEGAVRSIPAALTEMGKTEDEIQRGWGSQHFSVEILNFRSLLVT